MGIIRETKNPQYLQIIVCERHRRELRIYS